MATISLCMIVKNEEDVLGRCLDSVRDVVDEIVIVDTGSTDRTAEIAGQYTDRVYSFPWADDFAAARNESFSKATKEFILWLDADDVLLPKDREVLIRYKETLRLSTNVVMMKYNTAFDEKGNPTYSYYRERLIRNGVGFRWQGAVHEAITPAGEILYWDAAVTHKKEKLPEPGRNLRIMEKLLERGERMEPRMQFYYARELYYAARYEDAISVFQDFLDEGKGWRENCIDACQIRAYCFQELGKRREALRSLLCGLEYDRPRAELCCDIGKAFIEQQEFTTAIFWFETAAGCERNDRTGAFVREECYDYIPYLQLCVCWDRLGDKARAIAYNEKAGALRPDSEAVKYNRNYFRQFYKSEES